MIFCLLHMNTMWTSKVSHHRSYFPPFKCIDMGLLCGVGADDTGACEGSVACSTCHVIISPEHYDQLPEPDDEENDMLDLAFALEDT